MAYKNKRRIACDKRGRPLPPSDVSPRAALMRAAVVGPLGAALLPAGLLLGAFVRLPESVSGLGAIFVFMIFIGTLFLLYAAALVILGLRGRAKERAEGASADEVKTRGEVALATVTAVRTKRVRTADCVKTLVRVRAEYYDETYSYTRRFVSGYAECSVPPAPGDKVKVYYEPSSNLGYCVELPGE
ncbi:MAG TPA: hypothetical protein H9892_02640 [Candidatus Protoclostridium stercorigallinarum]|uniref:Uncharacterized protein n=1 Tax=Candidatus Protoclostridium stercorigallinarum TaxID=2838741 RepID=A0A9D1Q0S0_9FIRM|nr:hypothetical protein [Candidatus Protoclostridium stercorigallinarum]